MQRLADLPEVVFIVILISIDNPIGENEDLGIAIEGTIAQPDGVDRSAQILNRTQMRPITSSPTVGFRETDAACDKQA